MILHPTSVESCLLDEGADGPEADWDCELDDFEPLPPELYTGLAPIEDEHERRDDMLTQEMKQTVAKEASRWKQESGQSAVNLHAQICA